MVRRLPEPPRSLSCSGLEQLIAVAHPAHRDWLRNEAKRLYYP